MRIGALEYLSEHPRKKTLLKAKRQKKQRECVLLALYGGTYSRGWFDLSVISADET